MSRYWTGAHIKRKCENAFDIPPASAVAPDLIRSQNAAHDPRDRGAFSISFDPAPQATSDRLFKLSRGASI